MLIFPKTDHSFVLFHGASVDLKCMAALFSDFEEYAKKTKEAEHVADEKAHAIVNALNR